MGWQKEGGGLRDNNFQEHRRRLASRLEAYIPKPLAVDYPQAAVLIALLEHNGELCVLLTRRATHLRIHPGEIAFPGGKCDPSDGSLLDTALREAQEEVQLQSSDFTYYGQLDQRITRSEILVNPFVGMLSSDVGLKANPTEIADIFMAPVSFFLDRQHLQWDFVEYRGKPRFVAHFEYQHYRIWGMTAMMLVNMINVVFDAGFYPPELKGGL